MHGKPKTELFNYSRAYAIDFKEYEKATED